METHEKPQNISQPMSAHPSSTLFCDEHGEQIFNYCLNLECLKPLCPECINEHKEYHDEKNTKADFTTLRIVKNSCVKKIEAGISSLNQEVKKCELEYLLDPEALIEMGLKRLKKFKEKIYMMIEGHCTILEETLKRRVHENLLKGSDFEGIFDEMKNIIKELDYLKKNLESNNGLNYIKKICMLDLKALMKEFRSKVQNVIKSKDLEPIDIHIDENKFQNFKTELENMIFIKKDMKKFDFSITDANLNISQQNINNQSSNIMQPNPIDTKKEKDPQSSKFKSLNQAGSNNVLDYQPTENENGPKKDVISLLSLEIPDFYSSEARKTLHFFQRNKRILNVLDLDALAANQELSFKKYHLNNDIPGHNQSISLPDGQIYLIGGQMSANSTNKCTEIYKFAERDLEMQQVGSLNIARSCHGLCVMNEYIYIIGGYSRNGLCTQNERFNYLSKKCELLNDKMKYPAAYPSICNFRYAIFKFGGIGANQTLLQNIEKFDCVSEEWEVVNFKSSNKSQLLMNSACTQINHSDILILGGQDIDELGSNQCLLFHYEKNYPETGIFKEVDDNLLLPNHSGFCHNEGIWYDGQVYFVQNKEQNNVWNEEEKRILVLSSREWIVMK